jgi:molybdate transport system permease protein
MDFAPLWLSLEVAALATVLAAVLGVAVAVLVSNRRVPGRDLIDAITTAPMVMPPTVLGYYILVSLGRNSVIGKAWEAAFGTSIVFTITGAVVAATIGSLPLVIKAARAALEEVDEKLILAARTLGASRTRAFFTVHLPLASRGLIAGVMLGFARALGDFGATLMVAGDIPGETQTAALAIYDLIQSHEDAKANGMIVILTAIAVGVLWAVNHLTRRRDVAVHHA